MKQWHLVKINQAASIRNASYLDHPHPAERCRPAACCCRARAERLAVLGAQLEKAGRIGYDGDHLFVQETYE